MHTRSRSNAHSTTRTLARFALAVGLASLGCVVVDDEERPERDPFVIPPSEEPRDGEGLDSPTDPDFRGYFAFMLSGDESTELNSTELGESTSIYIDEDPLGDPPHCLFTFADRTPDAQGLQGYVLLQFFGAGCPAGGSFDLQTLDRARGSQGGIALKKIAVDVQSETTLRETSYRDATGTVTFEEVEAGRLRGRLEATATRRQGDPEDGPARVTVSGDFVAVPR